MTTASYTVSAIAPSVLDRIRGRGYDDFGNPVEVVLNQDEGGTPLRCCLREAALGERVALIAYQPPDLRGPYTEVGPVFVHAERCSGYASPMSYPDGFRQRRQLFRAYGHDGRQVHNQIVEPDEVDAVIAELFSRPDVARVHSRNLLAGCYMFAMAPGLVAGSDLLDEAEPVTRVGYAVG